MNLYERAKRHAWYMVANVFLAFLFIVVVDRFLGHSTWAFALAIIALLALNARILRFNCPRCGSNLFYRSWIALPWPNRTCSKCGLELDKCDQ